MSEVNEQPHLGERAQVPSQSLLGGPLKQIAHELRTPLTTLRLALQVGLGRLQRGRSIEPSTFEKALAQVDHLAALITKLSDAAIIASGEIPLELEALDIAEVLQQATDRFAQEGARHSVQFDRTLVSAYAFADRRRLERVVASLLDNACKFSPPETQIRVSLESDDCEVHFSIADNGIGVPVLEQDRVFELFYRASNASQSCTQGLGLGLFTAREIIAKHGGRIWLESELTKGSTLHVALPVIVVERAGH